MENRGRPFKPGNNFGRGRPRGSRNKADSAARKLLEEYKGPLMRRAIAVALQKEGPMLRMLVEQLLGPPKPAPIDVGPLRTANADDVSKASQKVVQKAARGQITLQEGHEFSTLLEHRRKAIEMQDHERRLRELESQS
jgi:hypothetical protein